MRKFMGAAVFAGLTAMAFSPSISTASTFVIGEGFATTCAEHAIRGAKDNETLHVCDRAIEEQSLSLEDFAKTLVNRSVVYLRRASYDDAMKDLGRAQELVPALPEIYINRGVVLMKRKMFSEAVAEIDHGLALDPDQKEKAYFDRGLAREAAGDVKGAYMDLLQAQKLKPDWDAPGKELMRFTVTRVG